MKDQVFSSYLNSYHLTFTKMSRYFANNIHDAEDLLQESLLKMYSKFDQFKPGSNFKAWGNMIIRNTYLNSLRKKKNMPTQSLGDTDDYFSVGTTQNEGISTVHKEEINTAMQSLKPGYAQVLNYIIEGYEYKDIAQKTGLPMGTIKSHIHLGRKQLKPQIKTYYN